MKKYKNPVLLCDYSDPDVIRVEDTFYLTASSFNFVPGLPLLESKNLVDWNLVGYAAKKIEIPGYDEVQNAKGIWAPSLRFHDGLFYIFFATPDEGIFEIHAEDFRGVWSGWNCVWSGKGFIDPCPLWDDDGKIYVVHGYAKSRIGFNSKLGILELDENLNAKTGDRIIFDGTKNQPTIEGPKIYKRNGLYYIFAPAGGVTYGWQTVLRSKNIFGGYDEKIVLAQEKTKINGPHQGGYVETQDGSGYFLHFQDAGIFGRITHLQPVKWQNGWPLLGSAAVKKPENENSNDDGNSYGMNLPEKAGETKSSDIKDAGEPLGEYFVPYDNEESSGLNSLKAESGNTISEFQFSGNAGVELLESGSSSNLKRKYGDGTLWLNPYVCTKKITEKEFFYGKEIFTGDFNDENCGERHGIIFLGNEYSALEIKKRFGAGGKTDGFYLSQIVSFGSEKGDETREERIVFEAKLSESVKSVVLKMSFSEDGRRGKVIFSCETDGADGKVDFVSAPFITENAHWVGGRFGWF